MTQTGQTDWRLPRVRPKRRHPRPPRRRLPLRKSRCPSARGLGGAEIGVALMGTWLRVREQIHSNFLGQHLANGSADVSRILRQLSGSFTSHGAAAAPARALGSLSALLQRESNVLAYIDGFWLTFWLAVVAIGFVSLISRAPPGPFTPVPLGTLWAGSTVR